MLGTQSLDELAQSLFKALPTQLQNLDETLKQQFKSILQTSFERLDLVTREEFDIQCKVLARTREKLEALQLQVTQLMNTKTEK